MMTLRVQVMWSSHSFRIPSWNVSADWLITGLAGGVVPCAGRTPEIAVTASADATAAIRRPTGIDHLRRITRRITKVRSLLNAAGTSRGQWNRSHAGGVGIPWRGCDSNIHAVGQPGVRRSVASSPPVTASLSLPAICWSTAPRELAPIEVFGAALGDLEQQPLGIRRVAAEVGHGVLLRGAWPPPGWVCRSRAHAPSSGPAGWPPLHHTTRPPRPRSDRPGCCRRTARSDGPAPAGRGHRCPSAPPSKTHPPIRLRIRSRVWWILNANDAN
jgi:hypothetical protein